MRKCLYCDKDITRYSFYSLCVEESKLCLDCLNKLKIKKNVFYLDELKVTSFYKYDSLFKSLLIQYKECYDEALKEVFLYRLDVYLKLKYFNYEILYVPSSRVKLAERGFNHLKEIFKVLELKEVEGLEMKDDTSQIGKGLDERRRMVNNYVYKGPRHKRVLIVDDVCTSGSTLLGIYKTLKPYCDYIEAITLAR